MNDLSGYRVVAVHAHPDDEVLFTGGTLADLARRGADVTVITVTLGEEGEVIGEPYQGLVGAGLLGGLRVRELADATHALKVRSVLLGGAGCFRDSGMAGSPAHDNPRALVNRVEEAAAKLRECFAQYDPHILVTYGPDGGYGHPDHIAVHQAVNLAAGSLPVWWAIFEREQHRAALQTLSVPAGWSYPDAHYLDNFTNEGAHVVYPLDDAALAAKRAGLAAHPTQIWLADGTLSDTNPVAAFAGINNSDLAPVAYALSNLLLMPLLRCEHYQAGANCPQVPAGLDGAAALLHGVEL